jgi:hypothetical protein
MENKEMSPELKKRIEEFHSDLVELVTKHKLDLVAGIQYTEQGIIPVIKISEAKEEQKVEEKVAGDLTKQ